MEVDVEVQGAEALNKVNRAAPYLVFEAVTLRASLVAHEDRLTGELPHRGEHVRLEGDKLPQLVGERENVLPHGHIRQNPVDDRSGGVRHAPARAARADRARLTGERDKEVVPAGIASSPSEALAEVTARQIRA